MQMHAKPISSLMGAAEENVDSSTSLKNASKTTYRYLGIVDSFVRLDHGI